MSVSLFPREDYWGPFEGGPKKYGKIGVACFQEKLRGNHTTSGLHIPCRDKPRPKPARCCASVPLFHDPYNPSAYQPALLGLLVSLGRVNVWAKQTAQQTRLA